MNILKLLRNSFSRVSINTTPPQEDHDGDKPSDLRNQMHQDRIDRLESVSNNEREMIEKFRDMGRTQHADYLLNKYIEKQRKIEREKEYFRGLGIELGDDEDR